MNNKKFISLIALISAINVFSSSCNYKLNKKDESIYLNDFEITGEKYQFYSESDTYDIEYEISKLGIENDELHNYKSYKIIRYIDNDDRDRVIVVLPYINFILDEKGNIIDKEYIIYDAFSEKEIIRLKDNGNRKSFNMDIDNIDNNEYIKKILSIGNIDLLKKIAISRGMNEEYVSNVYDNSIENKMISKSECARIYVMLVNSYYRTNFSDEYVKIKTYK